MKHLTKVLTTFLKVFGMSTAAILGGVMAVFITVMVLVVFGSAFGTSPEVLEDEFDFQFLWGDRGASAKIVVIPIHGLLLGSSTEETKVLEVFSDIGVTYGYKVKRDLEQLATDPTVAGVLLDIDSPGGTIFGSRAIADGIATYKKQTSKPVYAFVSGVAASGGYWAAASADQIYADIGTSIGSIGTIIGPFKTYSSVVAESTGLLGESVETTGGIDTFYISSGRYKDLGNPYREMSNEERTILQEATDSLYQEFIAYVAAQRGVSTEVLSQEYGALIFSDQQAKTRGLIDEQTSKDEAYAKYAEALNLDDFQVVSQKNQESFFDVLMGAYTRYSLFSQKSRACALATQPLVFAGSVQSICH